MEKKKISTYLSLFIVSQVLYQFLIITQMQAPFNIIDNVLFPLLQFLTLLGFSSMLWESSSESKESLKLIKSSDARIFFIILSILLIFIVSIHVYSNYNMLPFYEDHKGYVLFLTLLYIISIYSVLKVVYTYALIAYMNLQKLRNE